MSEINFEVRDGQVFKRVTAKRSHHMQKAENRRIQRIKERCTNLRIDPETGEPY